MTGFETQPKNDSQTTLAHRLAGGRIPVLEALHNAMLLAEALRRIHDEGRAHGALSPATIMLCGPGVELLPAQDAPGTITPYTAPEVIEGRKADTRSDIFSFGAVAYEMLTGSRAFDGASPAALAESITSSMPPSTGSTAVDRLIANCLARDPAARLQRMQKVLLELKLLSGAVRRNEAASASRREQSEAALRSEMQQMEARLTDRLRAHDQAFAEFQRAAGEALNSFRNDLAAVNGQIAATQERVAAAERSVESAGQRIMAHVEHSVAGMEEHFGRVEQAAAGSGERVGRLEQDVEAVRQHSAALRENMAEDLRTFDKTIQAQAASIESARTALAQTDDLVERVVEALESLQLAVLDQSEERAATVN